MPTTFMIRLLLHPKLVSVSEFFSKLRFVGSGSERYIFIKDTLRIYT